MTARDNPAQRCNQGALYQGDNGGRSEYLQHRPRGEAAWQGKKDELVGATMSRSNGIMCQIGG